MILISNWMFDTMSSNFCQKIFCECLISDVDIQTEKGGGCLHRFIRAQELFRTNSVWQLLPHLQSIIILLPSLRRNGQGCQFFDVFVYAQEPSGTNTVWQLLLFIQTDKAYPLEFLQLMFDCFYSQH